MQPNAMAAIKYVLNSGERSSPVASVGPVTDPTDARLRDIVQARCLLVCPLTA